MIHSAAGGRVRRAAAAKPDLAPSRKLYGLIEIDAAGTVLYTRFEGDGASHFSARDFAGRNFYTEVVPFGDVAEFRQRLDDFRRGPLTVHSMDFTCEYGDGPLAVRVLLARIRERSEEDVTKSILVHIRGPR